MIKVERNGQSAANDQNGDGRRHPDVPEKKGFRDVAVVGSLALSTAAFAFSARREMFPEEHVSHASSAARDNRSTTPVIPDKQRLPGTLEAVPNRVFRVVPYNDWPLFQVSVHEGQRLKFNREGGRWTGSSDGLTIQFETPAEIDGLTERAEAAKLEERAQVLKEEITRLELPKQLEQARVREDNARAEFERVEKLHGRTATTEQELQRARNMLRLASAQREELEAVVEKKTELANLESQIADRKSREATSDLALADFKRELSWGRVPVRRGQFEEVVVTKVSAALGDVPNKNGQRDTWVEVIDDRVLQVRAFARPDQVDLLRVDMEVSVLQRDRKYSGKILSIGAVAEKATELVPVLVLVENPDASLRINTTVVVDLSGDTR